MAQNAQDAQNQPPPVNPVVGIKFGDLEHFDPATSGSFSSWVQRFALFCSANNIGLEPTNAEGHFYERSNQRRDIFLLLIGPRAFGILQAAMLPVSPSNRPICMLVQTLKEHFEPPGLQQANRFVFSQRLQQPNESVKDYIAALQTLASNCNYNSWEEKLMDQLVQGIRHKDTQAKLISMENPTWAKFQTVAKQDDDLRIQMRTLAQVQNQIQQRVLAIKKTGGNDKNPPNSKKDSPSSSGSNPVDKSGPKPSGGKEKKFGPCHRCGRRHDVRTCPAINMDCNSCKKKGHLAHRCPSKTIPVKLVTTPPEDNLNCASRPWSWAKARVRRVVSCVRRIFNQNSSSASPEMKSYTPGEISEVKVFVSSASSAPLEVKISVNNVVITMEVDSGAGVSLATKQFLFKHFPELLISPTKISLSSASGPITVCGEANVSVSTGSQTVDLTLIVCDNLKYETPLLGRPWLDALVPEWREILSPKTVISSISVMSIPTINELKSLYPRIFDPTNDDPITGHFAVLVLKEGATPIKHRSYKLPFGIADDIHKILETMVQQKKAIHVRHAEWASPAFPVLKKNGDYRLVVDFKKTLNPQLRVDHYPIPSPEEIFSDLSNSSLFVSIDLKDAYMQLPLSPESQELCIMNTPRGFYKLLRLPFGVASAAAIFQSAMEEILSNIPSVKVYLDNILIHGSSTAQVVQLTHLVLARLEKHNVRLNLSKCEWFVNKIEFLGFIISSHGRQPTPSLTKAIDKAPVPKNVKEVRSFLGMINFYSIFIPQFATLAKPLFNLLKLENKFSWENSCNQAFLDCKRLLSSDKLLIHFDPKLPIVVYCDASPYGVGSALCHTVLINNKPVDRPVMFASSSLSPAQQNYAQIDREGLAIIHAVSKFHRFLWGQAFTLVTDCQAISRIFNPSNALPVRTGHRLQHWAAILQSYRYRLIHKKAENLVVADALSRLPAPITIEDVNVCAVNIKIATPVPLTSHKIAGEISNDPVLKEVFQYVHLGWPPKDKFKDNPSIQTYFKLRDSITISNKCLMFSSRVIIPTSLRSEVLKALHEGHPGIVRSKLLARMYVWWPSLGEDLTQMCSNCTVCALVNFKPDKVFVPWPKPASPFERVHIDFYEKRSLSYLIICDAYSKWLHVAHMQFTTANYLNQELMSVFAIFGFPKYLVSDNGQPFDSNEYAEFCTKFNIKIMHSPPYCPQSNGQAEKSVDLAKKGMEKIIISESNVSKTPEENLLLIQARLSKFLFHYRNTPTTTMLKTPNEIVLSFMPRTMLSNLLPETNVHLRDYHFRVGEKVKFKLTKKSDAVDAVIVSSKGANIYIVSIYGVQREVHHNQLTRGTL